MAFGNQFSNNQMINPKDATDCKFYHSYTILSKFATFRIIKRLRHAENNPGDHPADPGRLLYHLFAHQDGI
jgi:hypothetical protein